MKTILVIAFILVAYPGVSQSFYAQRHDKGRTTQVNGKTVMQRKQVTAYQQRSNLYKLRRELAHSKKRKNYKKAKTL